LGFFPWG